MASVAAVGPPPGLGPPKAQPSSPIEQRERPLGGQKYSRSLLLRLSQSPLVTVPEGIPPFADWFGEWETYTPRPHNHQHNHERHGNHRTDYTPRVGNRYAHVPEDGSGPMGEFSFHKAGVDSSASATPGTGYLTGFQGVRRRDGERPERGEGSRGFRKYEDRHERGGEERPTRNAFDREQGDGFGRGGNPRFPTSGKNPFGQLSASGTFKPAGRGEGAELPTDKRGFPLGSRMASYGRNDRDPPQLDENGRPIRQPRGTAKDASTFRDQRRRPEGVDDSQEGGEWETVPRSPESERRLARAGGLADSASDWRKGSGAAGTSKRAGDGLVGRGGLRGGRADVEGRKGAGGSSAFPSWMADANETPSWMDDSPTASSSGAAGEKRERGKLNFDAFKGSEVHATPMEGEDSIQAFKREMKRREAEARARDGPQEDNSGNIGGQNKVGPPPGLSRPQGTESSDDQRSSPSKPPGLSDEAYDRSNSDAPHADAGDRSVDSIEARSGSHSQSSGAAAAAGAGAGGRGSSRFARFFDGAAATNRAKEAQERAMAAHAAASSSSGPGSAPGQEQGGRAGGDNDVAAPSANHGEGMAALFSNMAMNASRRDASQEQSGRAGGAGGAQPTEADVQGMQKIMAMLRGGGSDQGSESGAKGVASPSASAASGAGSNNASANLMAMLAGGALSQGRSEAPPSPQLQHHSQNQRHSMQQAPPGLDISRLAAGGGQGSPTPARSQSPSAGFNNSNVGGTAAGLQNRSQSPGVPFRNERPQQGHYPAQSPGPVPYSQGPPPGFGPPGRPGSGFGMDPRMMGRPSPGQGGPNGIDSSPAGSGAGSGGRSSNGEVNIANLPPHIQQQLMGLPPHVQHAVLNGRGLPPGGPPPFHPSMQGIPPPPGIGGPPHHLGPFGPPPPGHQPHHFGGMPPFLAGHQGPYGGGANGGTSPGGLPPHLGPYGASPNPGPNAGLSPNPSAASPSGFPPGMMHGHHGHGPPPGIYGGQGR